MRDHRRLAAIVSADVAGYSRLMGLDESRTLAALKAHRSELIDPKIAEYGGRIVKTTGDGLLVEFPSVVDAVRCAVDVQRGMAERNVGIPPDERLEFRIGINVGDIIIDGDDIYGDGVNVSARLEALAEPGGICVSKVVRDQVLDKLSFGFDELGAQHVKNIARPVEVYRVELGSDATHGRERVRWQRLLHGSRPRVVVGVLALCAVGVALWAFPEMWKPGTSQPRPPHFSLAVLPFTAPGGNAEDVRLADALTNDVTTRAGQSGATVVAHSLAATYKDKVIDSRSVGTELKVRYLVQGEVRRVGERIVVNTQLIDTGSATQRWTDRLELDPRQAQDSGTFGAQLGHRALVALYDDEYRQASAPLPPGAGAMDIALHADAVFNQSTCANASDCVKAMLETRKEFARAAQLEPNLVFTLIVWAQSLEDQLWMDLHADRNRLVNELDDITTRATFVDPNDSRAWDYRSLALIWQQRWQAAIESSMKTSNLDPANPVPLIRRALVKLHTGQPQEALGLLNTALGPDSPSLDTNAAVYALMIRCRAHQALGRYEDAITDCERSIALYDFWLSHAYLAAAYAQKGDAGRAEAEKTLLLKFQPGITIADLRGMHLSHEPAYLEQTETHFYAWLRKAGIPEE